MSWRWTDDAARRIRVSSLRFALCPLLATPCSSIFAFRIGIHVRSPCGHRASRRRQELSGADNQRNQPNDLVVIVPGALRNLLLNTEIITKVQTAGLLAFGPIRHVRIDEGNADLAAWFPLSEAKNPDPTKRMENQHATHVLRPHCHVRAREKRAQYDGFQIRIIKYQIKRPESSHTHHID